MPPKEPGPVACNGPRNLERIRGRPASCTTHPTALIRSDLFAHRAIAHNASVLEARTYPRIFLLAAAMQAIDATDAPASANVIAHDPSPVAGILETRGFLGCSFAGGFVGSFTLVIVKPSEALPEMLAL